MINTSTTILGWVSILAGLVLPFTDRYQDWKQVGILAATGIVLIYFKNAKLIQETIKIFKK